MSKGRLPNFLIIGAQKSGSSWLSINLSKHPEVFIPKEELHFFDKSYNYDKGIEWYKKHFEFKSEKAIGEKTPDYLWANGDGIESHLSDVHLNIQKHLPEAKLIVILRNPVDRAISAVKHIIRSRRISPHHSIDDLLIGKDTIKLKGHGVIEYGFYAEQINEYLKLFKKDKILILIYEEVMKEKLQSLKKVSKFLEIDSDFSFLDHEEKINAHKISKTGYYLNYYFPKLYFRIFRTIESCFSYKEPFTPKEETIKKLYQIYKNPNQDLFKMIGRPISAWSAPFKMDK